MRAASISHFVRVREVLVMTIRGYIIAASSGACRLATEYAYISLSRYAVHVTRCISVACLAQCAMSARPNEPPALTTAHLKWYAWSGLGRLLGTAVSTLCNIILDSPYHVKFRQIDQRDSVEQVETMLPHSSGEPQQAVQAFVTSSTSNC